MSSDDGADEVKVFRRTEADDQETNAQSSQQLADDKKEVAYEADLEGRAPGDLLGRHGAFSRPSPSFFNPFMQLSPMYNQMLAMQLPFVRGYPNALSPVYPAMAAALPPGSPYQHAAMMELMRLASPNYLSQGGFNTPLKTMTNRAANAAMSRPSPLNQINQMQIPLLNSPMANVASSFAHQQAPQRRSRADKQRDKHIKKPLNAFMWFMKENRPKLMEELNYKEKQSAELNKELGKRWHSLDKEEQQKYFELAKNDRERHKLEHPGWSARENYALNKKKKRKRDKSVENSEQKKCRARYGINRQDMWCKFCKRKKKCEFASASERPTSGGESSEPAADAAHDSDSESEVGDDPMAVEALNEVVMQQEALLDHV